MFVCGCLSRFCKLSRCPCLVARRLDEREKKETKIGGVIHVRRKRKKVYAFDSPSLSVHFVERTVCLSKPAAKLFSPVFSCLKLMIARTANTAATVTREETKKVEKANRRERCGGWVRLGWLVVGWGGVLFALQRA